MQLNYILILVLSLNIKIEYLGCGYDILSNNATGDNQLLRDEGYRGPIINILNNFDIKKNNKFNDFINVTIRNNVMCEMFKEDVKIVSLEQLNESFLNNNIKQYGDVLNNSEEKNISLNKLKDRISKGSGLYMRKYLCTIYTASLIDKNRVLVNFKNSTDYLNGKCIEHSEKQYCTPKNYVDNIDSIECDECITPWIKFFNDYGTHISNKITMGILNYNLHVKN